MHRTSFSRPTQQHPVVHCSLLQCNASSQHRFAVVWFDFSYFVFFGACVRVHTCMYARLLVDFRLVVACSQLFMTDSDEQSMFSFYFVDTINKLISCKLASGGLPHKKNKACRKMYDIVVETMCSLSQNWLAQSRLSSVYKRHIVMCLYAWWHISTHRSTYFFPRF